MIKLGKIITWHEVKPLFLIPTARKIIYKETFTNYIYMYLIEKTISWTAAKKSKTFILNSSQKVKIVYLIITRLEINIGNYSKFLRLLPSKLQHKKNKIDFLENWIFINLLVFSSYFPTRVYINKIRTIWKKWTPK